MPNVFVNILFLNTIAANMGIVLFKEEWYLYKKYCHAWGDGWGAWNEKELKLKSDMLSNAIYGKSETYYRSIVFGSYQSHKS